MQKAEGRPAVAIVIGSFHREEMEQMLQSALAAAPGLGLEVHSVTRVPGSYEKPLAVRRLIARDDVAGVVVLGAIEKGETGHGEVMAQTVSDALVQLQLEYLKPIGFGIIGPRATVEQIRARLDPHAKAAMAAVACLLGLPANPA